MGMGAMQLKGIIVIQKRDFAPNDAKPHFYQIILFCPDSAYV